jgi:neutral ceramidase
MNRATFFLLFALVFSLNAAHAQEDRTMFQAGIGQVEMDIPTGLDMWGYLPPRKSIGTLDPLTARIFVFKAGEASVALVTLDLGRTFGKMQMDHVRAIAREKAEVQDVVFTASHTHSGPYLFDEYPDGKTPDWQQQILDEIAAEIVRVAGALFPARLGATRARAEIGHNRRFMLPDGRVKMLWANPTKIPTHPVDTEATILRIDDMEGNARGVLVGYACHPVVFGPDNAQYSADFPGAMSRLVAAAIPGNPTVAYVQGGCGDINPFMDKRRLGEDAIRHMKEAGEELGRAVIAAVKDLKASPPANPSVDLAIEVVELKDRRNPEPRYQAPVTVLLLNKEVCFVGLPGEPFLQFQTDLKARAGVPTAFFMGYTNGYLRYFPTIRAAAEGGYGASDRVAMTEVGAGERMMYEAYKMLYRMTGKLSPTPETAQ